MTIGRTFWKLTRYARAARFWLLLALAALAWLGFSGDARAQAACTEADMCDKATAQAMCMAKLGTPGTPSYLLEVRCALQDNTPLAGWGNYRAEGRGGSGWALGRDWGWLPDIFYFKPVECPAGQVWFGGSVNRCDTPCSARPAQVTVFNPKPGSQTCERGCMRSFYGNGDGETSTSQSTGQQCLATLEEACEAIPGASGNFFRNPVLGVCEPASPECPEGQKPVNGKCEVNDFCPIGQVLNSNNVCQPQEGECPAGSSRDIEGMCRSQDDDGDPNKCPVGQATGADGTCKPDTDNDNEPDDEAEEGRFQGGDSCKVPPTCSGDAIMCGQARIQWRIECNTRRNQKISGGGCGPQSQPVCVGESCDLMQYAQLMQAWHTRCAIEKLATGIELPPGGGNGNGDADFDAYAAGAGDAAALSDDGITPEDIFTDESENNGGAGGAPGGTGELNDDGLGFTRGCVDLPAITVLGQMVDFNAAAGGVLCNWMRLGGQFVLIIAGLVSLRMVAGGVQV